MHLYYLGCYGLITFIISYFIMETLKKKMYPLSFLMLSIFAMTFVLLLMNKEEILIIVQLVIFFIALIKAFSEKAVKILIGLWRNNKLFLMLLLTFTLVTRLFFAYKLTKSNLDPWILGGPDSAQYDLLAAHMFKEIPINKASYGRLILYNNDSIKWVPDRTPLQTYYDPVPKDAKKVKYIPDYHKPLYILFMGLIYKTFGHHRLLIRIAQAFMAALSVLFTYLIGKRLFSSNVGKVAALLDAGLGWFLCQSIYIAPEILALLLAQISIYFLISIIKAESRGKFLLYSAISGISFAGLALTRPEMLLFLPFLFIYIFIVEKRRGFRRVMTKSLCLFFFILIAITPWTIRNYMVFGKPLTSSALNPGIGYTQPRGYFPELSQIGVSFTDLKQDIPKLAKNIPFLINLIFEKAKKAFPRYWSWRSPLWISDFISFGRGTPFKFIQHIFLYIGLIIGLILGYKINPLSLVYYFFLLFFLGTFCLIWYGYYHAFVFVPVIHTFESLGLVQAVLYLSNNMRKTE